jgi:enoyl-CoA hydratase/carnithine racemase
MKNHVLAEKTEQLLVLTLNRPEKKNALTRDMYATLATHINRANDDPDIRCILLQANGDMFTAGNDLVDFAAVNSSTATPTLEGDIPLLPALSSARKPLVAAVNGRAVGVGFTLLLHCDLVFVSEDAALTAPFVNLALVPEAASSLLLPQRLGHVRAFQVMVLGETVDAAKAVEWGIANRAVPAAQLQEVARAAALAVAARAPSAVSATKRLLRDEQELRERMNLEFEYFVRQLRSPEFREAFTAFAERRAADFSKFT